MRELYRDACGRGRGNLPRVVTILLSRDTGGYPLRRIAKQFKMGHYSNVSVGIRRLKERLMTNPAAVMNVREIEDRPEMG